MKKRKKSFRNFPAKVAPIVAIVILVVWYALEKAACLTEKTSLVTASAFDVSDFGTKYRTLNATIYDQLLTLGIKEESLLTSSTIQKRGNTSWKQKVIDIQLPNNLSKTAIQLYFRASLLPLQPPVSYSFSSQRSPHPLSLVVFIGDYQTHRLNFIFSQSYQPEKISAALVAIVIDDLGYNYRPALPLFELQAPLTFSILPFSPFSQKIAQKAHRMGHEIILHLPMESWNDKVNGNEARTANGILLVTMTNQEITDHLAVSLEAVPYIQGVSNHMGSRFTEVMDKMELVIESLQANGLYFLDSKTTTRSVGYRLAREKGVKTAARDVFLDNAESYELTVHQLQELQRIALKKGRAIGIGHPHPSTIRALVDVLPEFDQKNIKIVPLSELMELGNGF
jgi:polysaccharide deacetylase 2 family uncharacterized protein YibQ